MEGKQVIDSKKIILAYICVIISAISLITGIIYVKPLLIISVISTLGYIWIDKKYLRCPNCNGFENLDNLCHKSYLPLYSLR